jgi:dTDP-4-dehydrorhamnose 3,5-epimerase-like enzyme
MNTIEQIRPIRLSSYVESGKLIVAEVGKEIAVPIQRVFWVCGESGAHRGSHAHRKLTQTMVCVNGSCTVICDDGKQRKEFLLDESDTALSIPPGIWAEQIYSTQTTILLVLCDLPFDEGDYIRDYEEFISYRKENLI